MTEAYDRPPARSKLLLLLPLLAFLALAALFFVRLGAGDPSRLPSALIGREAPRIELPALAGVMREGQAVPGLMGEHLRGAVTIVNVWASWCAPCREEAPLLNEMARDRRLRIVGINYKDAADNARIFLKRYGNPFTAIGVDSNGRTAIEWGVYGVPETFVVGRDGKIAYKLVGPITQENYRTHLLPAIEKAISASG